VVYLWATGWIIWGSSLGRGWECSFPPPHSDRFWGPPSLLSDSYQGLFRGVKLTTHRHLMPRSRMLGAIPPLT